MWHHALNTKQHADETDHAQQQIVAGEEAGEHAGKSLYELLGDSDQPKKNPDTLDGLKARVKYVAVLAPLFKALRRSVLLQKVRARQRRSHVTAKAAFVDRLIGIARTAAFVRGGFHVVVARGAWGHRGGASFGYSRPAHERWYRALAAEAAIHHNVHVCTVNEAHSSDTCGQTVLGGQRVALRNVHEVLAHDIPTALAELAAAAGSTDLEAEVAPAAAVDATESAEQAAEAPAGPRGTEGADMGEGDNAMQLEEDGDDGERADDMGGDGAGSSGGDGVRLELGGSGDVSGGGHDMREAGGGRGDEAALHGQHVHLCGGELQHATFTGKDGKIHKIWRSLFCGKCGTLWQRDVNASFNIWVIAAIRILYGTTLMPAHIRATMARRAEERAAARSRMQG